MSKERVNQINNVMHKGAGIISMAGVIAGAAIDNIALIIMALGLWAAVADIEIISNEQNK